MAERQTINPLFNQAPVIVSEQKLDFTEQFRLNDTIVRFIIGTDVDTMTKVGLLERILPGLIRAGECSCSCSCGCSCSCICTDGKVTLAIYSQAGRVW
jgi:hypothetical protein